MPWGEGHDVVDQMRTATLWLNGLSSIIKSRRSLVGCGGWRLESQRCERYLP